MTIKPATLAAFKTLVTETAKLDVRLKKLDKEVAKRRQRFKEATDANDTTLLDIQLKAIKGDLKEADQLLRDANKLLTPLENLKADDEFMQERDDDAAKVGGIVSAVRTGTARHYKALKEMETAGEAAWRQSLRNEDYAVRQLSTDEQSAAELKKDASDARMKAIDFEDMAAKARDARSAKGLANARAALTKLNSAELKIRVEITAKVLNKNSKDFGDRDISDATMKTLKDGYADALRDLESASAHVDELLKIEARVAAMEVKAIDIKKAREAMGLEAKADAQLKKVFDGPPAGWEKGLDAVGKTFGTGTTGKKYLASLRGAGIVPE